MIKRISVVQVVFGVLLASVLVLQGISCKQTPYTHGKILYDHFCVQCHQDDGTALRQLIPPLAGSDYLNDHRSELACLIRNGQKGEIVVNGIRYNQEMPAVPELSDIEIANVINYINSSWGNNNEYMALADVQKALEGCEE